MTTAPASRVAAAPISWGVCEVPGCGYQLDPASVLEEIADLGDAIPKGLYAPLGQGDVDVTALVTDLEENGYDGWYVLEQDIMLEEEPRGEGPVAEVRSSLECLRGVAP